MLYIFKERESPIRRREGYGDRPKKYRRGMKKKERKEQRGLDAWWITLIFKNKGGDEREKKHTDIGVPGMLTQSRHIHTYK